MKNSTFYFGFIFIIFFLACRKENNLIGKQQSQNSFFDSSVQYLNSQLSNADFSKLNLANKKVLRYHGDNIGVQIFEKNESSKKYLILKKEATGFSGNWIDMSGLKISKGTKQSGTVELQSINNESHVSFQIKDNKVINVIGTGKYSLQRSGTYPKRSKSYLRTKVEEVELPEIVVNGASSSQNFTSLFWLFEEDYAYEDMYFQGGGSDDGSNPISIGGAGSGGGGSSQDNVIAAPTFLPPSNPIADIKNEVKCFSNYASSTYSISVNVNEPSPGTREVFVPFANFRVGHTFLTLEQHNSDGSAIIRNIGFYPKNSAKPGDPIDAAIFGEDSNTPFDVSLKISVSGADFITVIHRLESQTLVYDLDNFNCTNSAMDALKSININLPSTKSTSALFSGNNPGDLGEDIRNMDLNNFSANNGSRKITRTVSNSNNQTAPKRSGDC